MRQATGNPSRIRHNPSRVRDGFGPKTTVKGAVGGQNGESVTNPSRLSVTDFGRRKYREYKEIHTLSPSIHESITCTLSRHLRARARGARRIGVMDSVRNGSRHVGAGSTIAPEAEQGYGPSQGADVGAQPTHLHKSNGSFPAVGTVTAAGSVAVLETVSLACPVFRKP